MLLRRPTNDDSRFESPTSSHGRARSIDADQFHDPTEDANPDIHPSHPPQEVRNTWKDNIASGRSRAQFGHVYNSAPGSSNNTNSNWDDSTQPTMIPLDCKTVVAVICCLLAITLAVVLLMAFRSLLRSIWH